LLLTMAKFFKILFLVLINTLLLFLAAIEIYTQQQISKYHAGEMPSNIFLERILLYGDVNHFMNPKNHDDLNTDNIRFHREASDIRDEDISVIFLGDSFVYGFLLSHRAAIPYQFEEIAEQKYPNKTIHGVNFGWVSASPLLELELLKKIGHRYKPDVVILDLDLGDFHDDAVYELIRERRRIFILADWLPATTFLIEGFLNQLSPAQYQNVMGIPKAHLYVNENPINVSRPFMEAYTIKNVDLIYQYTTEVLGAKFIFAVNPKTFHYNEKESPLNWQKDIVRRTPHSFEIFEYLKELSKSKPYPIITLLEAFQKTDVFPTAFERDAHWNRAGYRIAATELVRQCELNGCFD
jgi:hypothetical protein